MKQIAAVICLILILPFSVNAGEKEIALCTTLSNDIARLQCFDDAAKFLVEPASVNTTKPTEDPDLDEFASWERAEERDPISDRKNIRFTAIPTEEQTNMFGSRKTVFFQLRCTDNSTAAFLYFDDYQIQDGVKLALRLDDKEASTTSWSIASNRKAAGLWDGAKAIPFIKSILGSEQLTIRTFLDDATETYIFRTKNVGEYATEIAEACNWNLED